MPILCPCIHPRFPRPTNLCLQSSHPVTDTLPGVTARRDRRGVWGRDARPHAPGLRKMVSLRRHGGSDGVSDRSHCFMPQTARRMCLCGTQGGRDWRMRRHRPPDGNTLEGQNLPSGSPERAVAMSKRRWTLPETGERHQPSRPLQRDRSRGQKPLNGAPAGVTLHFSDAAPPAPRPKCSLNPRAETAAWILVWIPSWRGGHGSGIPHLTTAFRYGQRKGRR